MMTSITTTNVVWLLLLSPMLLRFMERWYKPKARIMLDNSNAEAGWSSPAVNTNTETNPNTEAEESDNEERREDESKKAELQKSTMLAQRDVHVVLFSYLLEALAEFCIGLSRTGSQLILCMFLLYLVLFPELADGGL